MSHLVGVVHRLPLLVRLHFEQGHCRVWPERLEESRCARVYHPREGRGGSLAPLQPVRLAPVKNYPRVVFALLVHSFSHVMTVLSTRPQATPTHDCKTKLKRGNSLAQKMNLTALEFIRGSFKDTADGLDALLPAWPLLNVIHCIVTAIALRKEPGNNKIRL